MAAKDSNQEELMLRLSNHVTGIGLILNIVDVNSFPSGSRLQQVIAQQLIELRGRINQIPVASVHAAPKEAASKKGVAVHQIPVASVNAAPKKEIAVPVSKAPKQPTPKPPVKVAPPVPAAATPPSVQDEGWRILENEHEAENFENDHYVYNHFFCIPCGCSVHPKNLLEHIRGRTHQSMDVEDDDDYDDVDWMLEEMEDCDYDRRIELMWDIVHATDNSIKNIEANGKGFYCRLCKKTLNGPFPVVDHVRGSSHQAE